MGNMNYWFFGLSGSGKTTLGDALAEVLEDKLPIRLDGDTLRGTVCKDLGFTIIDRQRNIDRAIAIASWEASCGNIVISSFITPFETLRDEVAHRVPNCKIIWVKCPIEICEKRDPKGLYKKARAGLIMQFTGIDSPFEIPSDYDLCVDTNILTVPQCIKEILSL